MRKRAVAAGGPRPPSPRRGSRGRSRSGSEGEGGDAAAPPPVPLIAATALVCAGVASYILIMRHAPPGVSAVRQRAEAALAEKLGLRDEWATGVSHLIMPDGSEVKLRANARPVPAPGPAYTPESENPSQPQVPDFLVSGSTFALTGWNPMGKEASDEDNMRANARLRRRLEELRPVASHVLRCFSANEATGWREEGFAVRFDRDDAEVDAAVIRLAREFGQAAVYKWHRWRWGPTAAKHSTPVQEVLPTSPDLGALASKGPVRRVP